MKSSELSCRVAKVAKLIWDHRAVAISPNYPNRFNSRKKNIQSLTIDDVTAFLFKNLRFLGLDETECSLKILENHYVSEETFTKMFHPEIKRHWKKIMWEIISTGESKLG